MIYSIDAEKRVIRLYHGDISLPWWKRTTSSFEREMHELEQTIKIATGLRRVNRRHDTVRLHVEFHIRAELFNRAAAAVRMRHGKENRLLLNN